MSNGRYALLNHAMKTQCGVKVWLHAFLPRHYMEDRDHLHAKAALPQGSIPT